MVQTIRNKANPFFAKQNHVKTAKYQKTKGYVDLDGTVVPPVTDLTYVGGKIATSIGGSLTVPLTGLTGGAAAAPQVGDLVFACIFGSANVGPVIDVTTVGYTALSIQVNANDTRYSSMRAYRKFMDDPVDPSITVVWPGASTYNFHCMISVWRNVAPTIYDPAHASTNIINTCLVDPPSVSPLLPGTIGLVFAGASHVVNGIPFDGTGLLNFTYAFAQTATLRCACAMWHMPWSGAGALNPPPLVGPIVELTDSGCAYTIPIAKLIV